MPAVLDRLKQKLVGKSDDDLRAEQEQLQAEAREFRKAHRAIRDDAHGAIDARFKGPTAEILDVRGAASLAGKLTVEPFHVLDITPAGRATLVTATGGLTNRGISVDESDTLVIDYRLITAPIKPRCTQSGFSNTSVRSIPISANSQEKKIR